MSGGASGLDIQHPDGGALHDRPWRKSTAARAIAVGATVAILAISQLYYAFWARNVTYDTSVLIFGVLLPLVVGCFLLLGTDQRVLLLGFIGLFWSVVDDAPVFFDSVPTWPRVTRFHPFLPHIVMEIVLHVLTFVFLFASIRFALKQSRGGRRREYAYLIAFFAFIASYAQNIPLAVIDGYVSQSWYRLDVVERLASVAIYALALWVAKVQRYPSPVTSGPDPAKNPASVDDARVRECDRMRKQLV